MINRFDGKTQEILLGLEKTQKEFWNISRVTAEFLSILIVEEKAKNVLEIGTSNGYSGIWLAKALEQTGGHLTSVEYYEKRIALARENFKTCGVDKLVTTLQGSACSVLENLDEDFVIDIAFVDANKKEYIDYYKLIDKHLRVGGVLTCDNVLSHEKKCRPFIEAINANDRYENVVLSLPAGLSFARKIK
ncbi:MAG: class I SAM-dependent methyltransferase [Candidatus Gastranaerophilales bacterium]